MKARARGLTLRRKEGHKKIKDRKQQESGAPIEGLVRLALLSLAGRLQC